MLTKKHITIDGIQTTIALEPIYWQAIDQHCTGEQWLDDCLQDKPEAESRASWIRQQVVRAILRRVKSA